jgi:hypothetical protein
MATPTEVTVTRDQQIESAAFWRRHLQFLRSRNTVSEEALTWLGYFTKPDAIGYEQGQIRPGELGKWDLYYLLMEWLGGSDLYIVCDLTASTVAQEEKREQLRNRGYDPDNADDVRQAEMLDSMSSAELDRLIVGLRRQLAK